MPAFISKSIDGFSIKDKNLYFGFYDPVGFLFKIFTPIVDMSFFFCYDIYKI